MKKLTILTLLCFVMLLSVSPVAAIVYGDLDGNAHPNVGLISRPDPDNPSEQRSVCTGTLISERVFLTAGHCTDFLQQLINAGSLTLDGIKVSFDPDDAIHNGLLAVSDIKTHPAFDGFKPTSNLYDVGVLILEKSPKKVTPAILAPQGFLDSLSRKQLNEAKFTVVGYGTTLDFPPPQFNSPDGKRRVAESQFQSLQETVIKLKQNKATGDGGTCSGDSGGPAFWRTREGQEILVGITSFGDSVCVNLGAYYRADISDTLNFLAEQ